MSNNNNNDNNNDNNNNNNNNNNNERQSMSAALASASIIDCGQHEMKPTMLIPYNCTATYSTHHYGKLP